ncbi:hypothetical protein QTP86_034753 [Hemibagrus guttatus]|nr:hypothetical protein QTP86_034753 [Hemibagrus guttatus]
MVRSKKLSEAFRKKIVDAYESAKGDKKISKEFVISHSTVQKIISKWRTFKTTANIARSGHPSKFTQRADHKMLKDVSKNLKISSQDLQQAFATVYAKVHESTIRKRLHNFNYYVRHSQQTLGHVVASVGCEFESQVPQSCQHCGLEQGP